MRRCLQIDRVRTQVACALLMMFGGAGSARGAIVFAPPDDSVDAANELKGIERELADRNYAAAAKRLDLLLAARGHPLASLSEGTLTSIAAWVDQIAGEPRKALAAACEAGAGAAARQALESVRNGRAVRPEDFYV